MNPLTIVCDLDSIVIDLLGPWVAEYNKRWNDDLEVSDLKDYHIEKYVKPECGNRIYDVFKDAEFYPNLPALPGAIEGLRKLCERGHHVVICTATAGITHEQRASAAGDKYRWCGRNIPFIAQSDIIIGSRKELVHSDIFIDDAPKNLLAYKKKWGPEARTIAISYPYNEYLAEHVWLHAQSYSDSKNAWQEILDAVQDVEEGID